jgi:hypothetical protein
LVGVGVPLNRALQELAPRFLPPGKAGYAWGDAAWLPATLVPITDGVAPLPPVATTPAPVKALQSIAWPMLALPSPAAIASGKAYHEYDSAGHMATWKAFTNETDKHEPAFERMMREYFRRQQASALSRLRSKAAKAPGDAAEEPISLAEWNRRLRALGQPLITATVGDAGDATLTDLGILARFDLNSPQAVAMIEGRAQRFARSVNETTYAALQQTLVAGINAGEGIPELSARVATIFTDAATWRTIAIARTEVVGAYNSGALEGAQQSGVVTGKNWLAALDSRTRESHVAAHRDPRNRNIPLDQPFHVGDVTGMAPHDLPSAKEVVNCRCTLTFETD